MVLNYPHSHHPGAVWDPCGQSWHDYPILLTEGFWEPPSFCLKALSHGSVHGGFLRFPKCRSDSITFRLKHILRPDVLPQTTMLNPHSFPVSWILASSFHGHANKGLRR